MTPSFSVRRIADDVQNGRRSAESVAREALDRARVYAAIQPQAWILRVPEDTVLASAQAIDARIAAGATLPLAGVPFVVKDNIDVAGLATTAACPEFAYTPERSSGVVELLLEAGALLLGKANLDQFATGLSGARSPYGVPHCVFNADYVSGGSSSGSAVLVGAGVAAFSLGTDTAGSGRVPAAINGLVGFKPTRGRWSLRGVVPACRSLDCVTVFTHDVEDAECVDAVVARHDPEDRYSRRAPARSGGAALPRRLGIALPGQLDFSGDGESAALFEAGLQRLADCGVELIPVDIRPLLEAAQLLYGGAFVAERLEATEELLRRKPAAVHPVVRTILQEGRLVSGIDLFRGIHRLQGYQQVAQALWDQVDVLCLPTAPTIFRVAAMLADPIALNSILGRYTNFVNLLDMSGIALPAGFRGNKTGFGLTLIAPAWAEPGLFALGRAYQQRTVVDRPAVDTGTPDTGITIAVVGAHLRGQPLHWQLESRHAEFAGSAETAAEYRLYAMAAQKPAKPALVHTGAAAGRPIALELYRLAPAEFGSFVAEVPAPLAIGTVTLSDGRRVKGFVAEPRALDGATDISDHGGWRAWLAAAAPP